MKIITHDGLFHADEVFAIALIFETIKECKVIRTREITQRDYNSVTTFLIDVGGVYNFSRNNFDHHQDKGLMASNMLVLEALYSTKTISPKLYEEVYDNFKYISDIDTGFFDRSDKGVFSINSLIRSFNFVENGFSLALTVARAWIQSKISSVAQIEESIKLLEEGVTISEGIITSEYPIHWKRGDKYKYLVAPVKDKPGQWGLYSLNSMLFPIIKQGNEIFIHEQAFIAIYKSKHEAISAMIKSARQTNK